MPDSSSRGIFLSYRREDEDIALEARLFQLGLQEELDRRLPQVKIFTDEDAIGLGQGFAAAISNIVGSCTVLVALIGPRWTTEISGRRQLDEPDDWVRLEIQTALEHGLQVIPVLLGGATMPSQQELPSELHKLVRLDALVMGRGVAEGYYTVHQLVTSIQRVLDEDRSVFISYRRKLSEHLARSVNNYLIGHNYDTFMDLRNLDSGEFEQVILGQIETRQHFLVLLQPGSLNQIGKDGDWLRREIAHALTHRRNVVPVTADGFELRHDLALPPDIAKLPSLNAVPIPPGYFDEAMDRLRTRFLKMPSNR